ncbi:MAG: ubiquinone/menaquinone biosynthesis methyltransferase [Anaerolineales bacterium]|nr:ubiquinone/menaquinone biosynthesis methyltransferase [Anaerolineales bacterium]
MANLTGHERAQYVQEMFSRIAQRYDLMNRIMTAGQDVRWRREVIRRAALPKNGRLLDLGAGTGDLARQALRRYPSCRALAADSNLEMMRVGKSRSSSAPPGVVHLDWAAADAQRLPFPDNSFNAVVSGFLLRNVSDVPKSLQEQYRVLKPGGRIVALDTTPPPRNLLKPLIRFHLQTVIPTLGGWISGQADAYHYLPDSTEAFLEPEQLAARLIAAGFQQVGFQRLMFGAIAIHWGVKNPAAGEKGNE